MQSFVYLLSCFCFMVTASPEQGLWHLSTSPGHEYVTVKKSMFKDTRIIIKVKCDPDVTTDAPSDDVSIKEDLMIKISWVLMKTPCWNQFVNQEDSQEFSPERFFDSPENMIMQGDDGVKYTAGFIKSPEELKVCDHNIILSEVDLEKMEKPVISADAKQSPVKVRAAEDEVTVTGGPGTMKQVSEIPTENPDSGRVLSEQDISAGGTAQTNHPVATIINDGVYFLIVNTEIAYQDDVKRSYKTYIDIQMKSDYGYLSAVDWPLLGFYAAMCIVYLLYGLAWLVVSFMRWRELLRVQYWIGAVILLGMLEKAVFTAEYSSINQRGYSVPGLIIFAELVSCAKRTLARMLVIIVSLGFGIVKPRLGVVLHRVVGVGLLYFVLASIEGCTRTQQTHSDPHKQVLLALLPLALLESAICFWIFTALVQTTRTLRLRRNLVKLSLYRHFTNTLAFAVVTSVIFMLWSLKNHQLEQCLTDWKELWVDDAFWHVLFAIILLVIMILWRPSNNNQRFAFSPLLDDGSDADDEEEGEKLMADVSDTTKYRNTRNSTSSSPRESRSVEDDLKWVEENIPSSIADTALPILDSDEEIVTTKFEISKMQ